MIVMTEKEQVQAEIIKQLYARVTELETAIQALANSSFSVVKYFAKKAKHDT